MPVSRRGFTRATLAWAIPLSGLLAVAGCSDSDVGGPGAASDGGSTETFCAEFQDLENRFSDPSSEATVDEVVAAIRELDPPEEIREDVERFADGFAEAGDLDPNDPANAEQIAEVQALFGAVNEFRAAECEPGAGGAPTDGSGAGDAEG